MNHGLSEMAIDITTSTPMTREQRQRADEALTASMRCLEDPKVPPRVVTVDPREPRYHRIGEMVSAYPPACYDQTEASLYGIEKARELWLERHPEMAPHEETVRSRWIGMSNFDHTIADGFGEALKAAPSEAFGFYAGWNFSGRVFWDGTQFCCEVWRYHEVVDVVDGATLEDIMERVSDKYGAD